MAFTVLVLDFSTAKDCPRPLKLREFAAYKKTARMVIIEVFSFPGDLVSFYLADALFQATQPLI